MVKKIFKYKCPFCKEKTDYTTQELSEHFIKNHPNISPNYMTEWYISKSLEKTKKKENKLKILEGYDKKLRNKKNKKKIKVIYTPMGNKR